VLIPSQGKVDVSHYILVLFLGKADLKKPVHFQEIPCFTSFDHMVKIGAFLLGDKVNVILVLYVVVDIHLPHIFAVFVKI
jgi:hypothetical protein